MKKIIIQLQGGLGNQLFTYTAGATAASRLGLPVVIDTSEISSGYTARSFDLNGLDLPVSFKESRVWRVISPKFRNISRRLLQRLFPIVFKRFYLVETSIGYVESLSKLSEGRIIRGYFQSWRYFEDLKKSKGYADIKIKDPSAKWKNLSKTLRELDPIVVHFRRGDYLTLLDTFGALSEKYFEDGIKLIQSSLGPSEVWLFTDGEESINPIFINEYVSKVFSPKAGLSDLETMMLMSQAKKFVISNSTFSWWAARLADPEAVVVAPKKWFKGLDDPLDLIPHDWHQIKSTWLAK